MIATMSVGTITFPEGEFFAMIEQNESNGLYSASLRLLEPDEVFVPQPRTGGGRLLGFTTCLRREPWTEIEVAETFRAQVVEERIQRTGTEYPADLWLYEGKPWRLA